METIADEVLFMPWFIHNPSAELGSLAEAKGNKY